MSPVYEFDESGVGPAKTMRKLTFVDSNSGVRVISTYDERSYGAAVGNRQDRHVEVIWAKTDYMPGEELQVSIIRNAEGGTVEVEQLMPPSITTKDAWGAWHWVLTPPHKARLRKLFSANEVAMVAAILDNPSYLYDVLARNGELADEVEVGVA